MQKTETKTETTVVMVVVVVARADKQEASGVTGGDRRDWRSTGGEMAPRWRSMKVREDKRRGET